MQQYKEAEIARAVEEIKKELARRDALERDACLAFWRALAIADKQKELATFVIEAWREEKSKRQALEGQISALEEENARLRNAIIDLEG